MISWAVTVRGIVRVEWLVSPANAASIAVAKRLGMTYEGTMRSVFPMNGESHDLQVWSVLADEWRHRPAAHSNG
jgi:RimJ/RimL family protein N-acetyltransferase